MGLPSPHFGELSEYMSYWQEKTAVCRPNFPETCSCLFLMILSSRVLLMVTNISVHSNHYPYPLLALKEPWFHLDFYLPLRTAGWYT